MLEILAIFLMSTTASLALTPVVRHLALKYQVVDHPSQRKVHKNLIPRLGGVAIYVAFLVPVFLWLLLKKPDWPAHSLLQILCLLGGSSLIFALGLADDICGGLDPVKKLFVQICAAVIAFMGGIEIKTLAVPLLQELHMGWLSLPVTVLWFILVINALNFIDGLDGLSAGISFFASLLLLIICLSGDKLMIAVGFAALAGATLGFLRYNFNPASIFMGDSGSYFLGYMLAALSILGSMKSQTTVVILIPTIALGLPLIDVMLAPIRRFLLGKNLFAPDKSHIHHKLLQMGLNHRKVVLLMYGFNILLGLLALVMVNLQDQKVGLLLLLLGLGVFWGIRKLGYLEYLAVDKISGYFRDVMDELGVNRERRTFLNHQIAIAQSVSLPDMWDQITLALQMLRIDEAEFCLTGANAPKWETYHWRLLDVAQGGAEPQTMQIKLPLAEDQMIYGTLYLKKDILQDYITHHTLRRIEHLRRAIIQALKQLEAGKAPASSPASLYELGPGPQLRDNLYNLK